MSTLARAIPWGIESTPDLAASGLPVVAVVRSHAAGLTAATMWSERLKAAGAQRVLGLVIVRDAPGRFPKNLESMAQLAGSGFARTWRVPWVEEWRLGFDPAPNNTPRQVVALAKDLADLVGLNLPSTTNNGANP